MHRPCRGFRRGIDGGGGGGGGGCCPCGGGGSGVAAGKCRELAPSPPSAFLDDTQGRTRGCRKIFADKLFGIAIRYRKELQILLNIEKDERKVI